MAKDLEHMVKGVAVVQQERKINQYYSNITIRLKDYHIEVPSPQNQDFEVDLSNFLQRLFASNYTGLNGSPDKPTLTFQDQTKKFKHTYLGMINGNEPVLVTYSVLSSENQLDSRELPVSYEIKLDIICRAANSEKVSDDVLQSFIGLIENYIPKSEDRVEALMKEYRKLYTTDNVDELHDTMRNTTRTSTDALQGISLAESDKDQLVTYYEGQLKYHCLAARLQEIAHLPQGAQTSITFAKLCEFKLQFVDKLAKK